MKMYFFFYNNTPRPLGSTLSDLIYFSSITQCAIIFFYLFVFLASFGRVLNHHTVLLQSINLFGGHDDFPVFDTLMFPSPPLLSLFLAPLFSSALRLRLLSPSHAVFGCERRLGLR